MSMIYTIESNEFANVWITLTLAAIILMRVDGIINTNNLISYNSIQDTDQAD